MDEPIAVITTNPSTETRIINYNWRGQGMSSVYPSGQGADASLGNAVAEIDWPAATQAETYFTPALGSTTDNNAKKWLGTFVQNGIGTTGMLYRRNRYFDTNTGRFTEEDPIGIAGGVNQYGFASGDPVNFSDPFGLCPPEDFTFGPECLQLGGLKANISPIWIVPGVKARRFEATLMRTMPGQIIGAMHDFWSNYSDMRDANTIDADKFFHAKANCEAAQRGSAGAGTARIVSDTREWTDQRWPKYDPPSASAADQAANRAGRAAGSNNSSGSCSEMVQQYRPRGLDSRY